MERNGWRLWRWTRRAGLGLLAAVGGYALAAVVGGAIPVNPGWRQAASGVRIFVADNGVHTDLVLPVAAAGVDWRELLRPGHLADPAAARRSHVSFGWGDRDFYLNTPSWWEMNPLRALAALLGLGPTVLHVAHMPEPRAGGRVRAILLAPHEYRRLAAHVRATFALRDDGGVTAVRGYFGNDAFYEAKGGYSAYATCNEWTGAALRAGGVRIGAWTPLPFTVMWWL